MPGLRSWTWIVLTNSDFGLQGIQLDCYQVGCPVKQNERDKVRQIGCAYVRRRIGRVTQYHQSRCFHYAPNFFHKYLASHNGESLNKANRLHFEHAHVLLDSNEYNRHGDCNRLGLRLNAPIIVVATCALWVYSTLAAFLTAF